MSGTRFIVLYALVMAALVLLLVLAMLVSRIISDIRLRRQARRLTAFAEQILRDEANR